MHITALIAKLQAIQAFHGDILVVTGIDLTGYGNPISDATVKEAYQFDTQSSEYVEPKHLVVDLTVSENSDVCSFIL